ncbi:MAG: hypothetical protein EBW49_11380, partial [Betaproteobacteria bacterium]|nr:hypothetical protein [Betaproteobacteria bacterium]
PVGVQASFDVANGVLSIKGSATQAAYETILANVIFQDNSANPNTRARDLRVDLTDTQGATSRFSDIRVTVTPTDDVAQLDLSGSDFVSLSNTALFTGGLSSTPTMISSQASLRDADNSTFKILTIALASPANGDTSFQGPAAGDVLGLNSGGYAASQAAGLSVTFNNNSTSLTLSAPVSSATGLVDISAIESVLRGVIFNHIMQGSETLSGTRKVVVTGVDANNKAITSAEVLISMSDGPFAVVTSASVNGATQYTVALDKTPGSSSVLVDLSASLVSTGGTRLAVKDIFKAQNIDASNLTVTGVSSITLTGNSSANKIVGSTGADVIQGGGGADVIQAGAGDDTIVSTLANMATMGSVDGGSGTDTLT